VFIKIQNKSWDILLSIIFQFTFNLVICVSMHGTSNFTYLFRLSKHQMDGLHLLAILNEGKTNENGDNILLSKCIFHDSQKLYSRVTIYGSHMLKVAYPCASSSVSWCLKKRKMLHVMQTNMSYVCKSMHLSYTWNET
jgi:hypothetical protein